MNVMVSWPIMEGPEANDAELLRRAKAVLKLRRARDAHFGTELARMMGDPSYEILIDLYVAHRTGQVVNVSSACHANGVPMTTGLRILEQLDKAGAIHRNYDPKDKRRRLVELRRPIVAVIERHLRALPMNQDTRG